ncbi:MAG: sigma-54-dependent Fis family transcriptional regulator [Deltaproteobacteria bacterium]|nr:sigma-54-dependent Fis family transcriptional regulator [Deltaproteobacteria bacterium]MBT4525463.1 sigma-54-dependent Fis family transcriptional regulator [Deltaproteobacteria bacterium]
MIKNPILIVDDEVEMRIAMSAALKKCGYPVELSHNAIDALNKCKKNDYSLVITDMTMPKRSGLELLKDIKSINSNIPIILITAYGTIDTAISAMKHGAFDYVQKPFDFDTFIFLIERALAFKQEQQLAPAPDNNGNKSGKKSTGDGVKNKASYKEIITDDKGMIKLLEIASSIAPSKATVLIQSESGTGKELLARYIHNQSERNDKAFVAINCAALPENLLESELFGHKKGAFTGAINEHRGKFEQANGGTILLDEISEMPLSLQAKLLRVLQEYTIDRVGGTDTIPVDVRVVATTNRNLLECIENETFREDLYFRLNVIPLELSPLRERKKDIRILADYFVNKFSEISDKPLPKIQEDVFRLLENYNWRGNVRELENVIERAVLLCDGKFITIADLLMNPSSITKRSRESGKPAIVESSSTSTRQTLELEVGVSLSEAEKQLIFKTLTKTNGNRTKAAEILGISIRTLRNKLNEYKEAGDPCNY